MAKKHKQTPAVPLAPTEPAAVEPIEVIDVPPLAEADKKPSGRLSTKSLGDLTLPALDIPTLGAKPEGEAEPAAEAVLEAEPVPAVEAEAVTLPADDALEAEVYETSEEIFREAGREGPVREKVDLLAPFKTGGVLLLICAVVTLIVSFVNAITADTIAAQAAARQQAAIGRIFGANAAIEAIEPLDGTKAVYAVGEEGYCVSLDARGFGGKLDMMVGVGRDGVVRGVEIVSHSETPGFGDAAATPDYLSQYIGMGTELTLGTEIVAVSGATISSRGVIAGVNAATAALIEAGLVEVYHAPPPPPELTEEERLQAEIDALIEELGITEEEFYEGGYGE